MHTRSDIRRTIEEVRNLAYDRDAPRQLMRAIEKVVVFIRSNDFANGKAHLKALEHLAEQVGDLSEFRSREDKHAQRMAQRSFTETVTKLLNEHRKVFVVHGWNAQMRDGATSLLGRLRLDYVVLQDERNGGATVVEKFLREADDCDYAVVILSGDDLATPKGSELPRLRARQNVVLELGYFLGKIGRRNIVVLHEEGASIEMPSDLAGIVHIPMDTHGAWKHRMIRELRDVGAYLPPQVVERV